jgi:hypothetical protein
VTIDLLDDAQRKRLLGGEPERTVVLKAFFDTRRIHTVRDERRLAGALTVG